MNLGQQTHFIPLNQHVCQFDIFTPNYLGQVSTEHIFFRIADNTIQRIAMTAFYTRNVLTYSSIYQYFYFVELRRSCSLISVLLQSVENLSNPTENANYVCLRFTHLTNLIWSKILYKCCIISFVII